MRAITVDNISKLYHIGERAPNSLRDAIARLWRSSDQAASKGELWALKDISFDVQQGDRLGVIGRNGAGKSTLLKILSRITKPTKGSASIRGRVGSLLEVGTGSGYQTALLAELSFNVFSVEKIRALATHARAVLDRLQYHNIAIQVGDGTIGWPEHAPFDAIMVTAGAPDLPRPLLERRRARRPARRPVASHVGR